MTKQTATRKSEVITLRATLEQKLQLVAKATGEGLSLSQFILSLGAAARVTASVMTTELLEERLGLDPDTLDRIYREVDTDSLKDKTAEALATLDPNGLKWWAEKTSKGNVWTNEAVLPKKNLFNRTLYRLMDTIFKADFAAMSVQTETEIVFTTPEPIAVQTVVYTTPEPVATATTVHTKAKPIVYPDPTPEQLANYSGLPVELTEEEFQAELAIEAKQAARVARIAANGGIDPDVVSIPVYENPAIELTDDEFERECRMSGQPSIAMIEDRPGFIMVTFPDGRQEVKEWLIPSDDDEDDSDWEARIIPNDDLEGFC